MGAYTVPALPLGSGTRLGQYEVVAPLGAGGMGEVFRARDTRLGRDVAIKLLPESVTGDAERAARFAREAQLLAALNHPHIAQLYSFEEHPPPSRSFLVMELVEGRTLAEMIQLRQAEHTPGVEWCWPIARQIAAALDAAHEKGIVHRDLKPANVKVTDDGTVKVLDFGLAKAMDANLAGSSAGSAASLATVTSPAMTAMGMILGTAAYMAPEQARGRPVDKRADIWAFGCVLFEMLTGRKAFDGETVTDILGAIVHKEPDWTALPASTPASVRLLLRQCLQKDPKARLRDIGDASLILDAPTAAIGTEAAGGAKASHGIRPEIAVALAIAAALGGALASWATFRPRETSATSSIRFAITLPTDQDTTAVAITRAGDAVVLEADRLYVRRMDDAEVRPIEGTAGARNVFLSPDGRWVGFFAGGAIKKVALAGGDALTICTADGDTPGAAWGPGNTVLFSPNWNTPLMSVSADGGVPAAVSTVNTADGELGHWWPDVLPGERAALFTIWRAGIGLNDARIGVLDFATRTHRTLMPGAMPKFIAPDRLLYFHAGSYHVVGFDLATLTTRGDPIKVLTDATPLDPLGTRRKPIAVSARGTLAYVSGSLLGEHKLGWLARGESRIADLDFATRPIRSLALSPDGRRAAGERLENGIFELWLLDLIRGAEDRLVIPGSAFSPVWSPDSQMLAYGSMVSGHFDVQTIRLDDRVPRSLIADPHDQMPGKFASDGDRLLIVQYEPTGIAFAITSLKAPTQRTVLPIPSSELESASLSPKDQWLAVESSRTGRPEVVVYAFPQATAPLTVSRDGGSSPFWSTRAPELFYRRGDDVIAVTYRDDQGRFTIVKEERIASARDFSLVGVAPDGRFLVARELRRRQRETIVVPGWGSAEATPGR